MNVRVNIRMSKIIHTPIKVGVHTYPTYVNRRTLLLLFFAKNSVYIPLGGSGSHNVCVCMHHQNVKLKIHAVKASLDYKNVLKLCVCDITNQNCILHHCDLCSNESLVRDLLWSNCRTIIISLLTKLNMNSGSVQTGVSQRIMRVILDDFLAKPLCILFQLTEHYFVAKKSK